MSAYAYALLKRVFRDVVSVTYLLILESCTYSNLLVQNTFRVEREDELKGPGFPSESQSTILQTKQNCVINFMVTSERTLDFSHFAMQ